MLREKWYNTGSCTKADSKDYIDNTSSGWGPMSLPEIETLDSSHGPDKTRASRIKQGRRGYPNP